MNSDFNTQWRRRSEAAQQERCPMDDERMQAAMRHAMSQPLAEGTGRVVSMHPARTGSRRSPITIVAAAACLAAILVPASLHAVNNSIPTVNYQGQQVRFVCNNNCNAQSVIASFDSYLKKL